MKMSAKQTDYKKYVIIAIAFHVILLLLFLTQLNFSNPPASEANNEKVINAVAINTSRPTPINRERALQKLAKLEQEKAQQLQEQAEQEKLQQQQQKQTQEQQALQQQMQLKEQKIAQELQRSEQAKLFALKNQADKQKAEQKAELAKQKQQDIKLAKQQLLQDLKQQDPTLQKDIPKQELAKEDAALKHQDLAKQKQQDADDLLQQQLAQEQNQLSASRAQNIDSVVAKYKAFITNAIGQHWLIPDTSDKNLSASLDITLAPGGVVLDVKLIKTSGDPALDRSAIAAVYKSSPLPVPTDASLFDNFRELNLTVRPENIMNG